MCINVGSGFVCFCVIEYSRAAGQVMDFTPDYSVELINLLGNEFTLKEASAILNRPQRTLYGWVQTLRPIFKEYLQTIDHI